ncbi:MAG TPA: YciI family protein [Acidothermaceae bacterium]
MKYVLIYESRADLDLGQLRAVFPEHRARWAVFQEQGTLLLIGPYADRAGALAVFTTQEAAEEFAATVPFVTNGLVAKWEIKPWAEALLEPL